MSSHRHCLQALKRRRRSVWADEDDDDGDGTGANETPSLNFQVNSEHGTREHHNKNSLLLLKRTNSKPRGERQQQQVETGEPFAGR